MGERSLDRRFLNVIFSWVANFWLLRKRRGLWRRESDGDDLNKLINDFCDFRPASDSRPLPLCLMVGVGFSVSSGTSGTYSFSHDTGGSWKLTRFLCEQKQN